MTMKNAVAETPRRFPTADLEPDARTLVGEHARLLRDVGRRAAPVLALAEVGVWPAGELRTLVGYLRTTVLRQASDEEVLLYPNSSSAPFAELSADHVRLHALTEQLDRADATPCPVLELCALVDQLLTVLGRHLIDEQAVLAALPGTHADVPSAAGLVAGTQAWLPANDEPVRILLDALPEEKAVQLCIERLLRLRPGQTAEIRSSEDGGLRRVCEWMHNFDSSRYGIAHIHAGPTQSGIQVTRRHTT